MTAIKKLEERLAALEADLEQVKKQLAGKQEPWWKAWMGAFQDDPYFEQAMKYGQQWRKGERLGRDKKGKKAKNVRP